ncbi:UNVERIFIED_CONTAM: hypothetical protein Sradi_1601800 [Sesamum radiatum]|uniref:Exportin-4 n=1 Tax=Sesamum radiatum TaxID=300843 RepID=A0AAW2UDN5_SESRA
MGFLVMNPVLIFLQAYKDEVDFASEPIETYGTNISQVVYTGLHIVTPLITMDLLKYPKLCHSYFSLLSHMLEVYPEIIAQLNVEACSHILGTLDFGLRHQNLANELIERQVNRTFRSRLTNAFQALITSNNLSSTLDRMNYQRFRKNLLSFLIEVRGFLRTV